MTQPFKTGDRVAAYDQYYGRRTGTVARVLSSEKLDIQFDDHTRHERHPKQCRRLRKLREFWIWKHEEACQVLDDVHLKSQIRHCLNCKSEVIHVREVRERKERA